MLPFITYCKEDKSGYPSAASKSYQDTDGDFLIGDSGGFLMNINFVFKGTEAFSEVGNYYSKYKKYTHSTVGSDPYRKFYVREADRRKNGMTLNCKLLYSDVEKYENAKTDKEKQSYLKPLHITGDHYNYLNYGRILRTPNETEREELDRSGNKKQELIEGFPRFWDGDYWNFKIDDFISINSFHLCKAKARGKGFSFKRGSQAANTMNLYPKSLIILAAFDLCYLTDPGATADMLKNNLNWYETKTYWERGFISEDITSLELGYKEQGGGHKHLGWLSKGISVTCGTKPGAAAGKRALEIDFEEAGYFPNLAETLRVTLSSTEVGSKNVGTIRIYGTAGAKGADWAPFSAKFYNPYGDFMMPFENIWDDNARHTVCGFFFPQVWCYEPFIDEDGNSQLIEAYYDDLEKKEQAEKNKNLEDYLQFVAQRANKPSEAFGIGKENIFSSPELNNHIIKLQSDSAYKYYIDGLPIMGDKGVEFKSNNKLSLEGNVIHPFIENVPIRSTDDPVGCMRVYHFPYVDPVTKKIPDNLYYMSYDTVAKDKKTKEFNVRNSLNAFHIYTYPNSYPGVISDGIVATYAGRLESLSSTNRLIDTALDMYNAKCLAEVDRGQTVEDFRRWHKLHKLLKNPTSYLDENIKPDTNADYGIIIGTSARKEDGLLYVADWIYTPIGTDDETGVTIYVLNTIDDLPTLLELQRYCEDGNFDRISSLIVGRYQAKMFRVKHKKPTGVKRISIFKQLNMHGYN